MDRKFLEEIQEAGWHLEQVGKRQVVARCPAEGCGMRALLSTGAKVPQVDPNNARFGLDRPVESYDDFRRIMRERREGLGLRIADVEEVSGVGIDYLRKAEKEEPVKMANFQTALEWAQSLGYEIVLRPARIESGLALRTICDTRDKLERRITRNKNDRERRGAGTRPFQDPAARR